MRRLALICGSCFAVALLFSSAAAAQTAYVANSASNTVSVLEASTGQAIAPPIGVGAEPTELAITPDGTRAYVTNQGSDSVSVIATASNSPIAMIPVGDEPTGIAVSPSGTTAYVANQGSDSVSVIDVASSSVVGPPIVVGDRPEGIALLLTREQALVAQRSGGIAVIDLARREVSATIPDALGPTRLTVTPDGTRAFVTNADSASVSLFSLITNTALGVPILIGANPSAIALSPNGYAYAASSSENTVSALDAVSHSRVGPPIPGFSGPSGVSATADGATVLVSNSTSSSVSLLDTPSASVISQVPTGASPKGIAITPDQPPRASFNATRDKKQGLRFSFDASSSQDSDSQIASYSWDFGDGKSDSGPLPSAEHTYEEPGTYRVTLTVTDAQGCSTALRFSGQTASCNGSSLASSTLQVKATDTVKPVLRLRGSSRQLLGPTVLIVVGCPKEDCAVVVSGALSTTASLPKGKGPTKARFPLAPKQVKVPAGGKASVRLRVPGKGRRAARRALSMGGRAEVRLRVVARDGTGNVSRGRRQISLVVGG